MSAGGAGQEPPPSLGRSQGRLSSRSRKGIRQSHILPRCCMGSSETRHTIIRPLTILRATLAPSCWCGMAVVEARARVTRSVARPRLGLISEQRTETDQPLQPPASYTGTSPASSSTRRSRVIRQIWNYIYQSNKSILNGIFFHFSLEIILILNENHD